MIEIITENEDVLFVNKMASLSAHNEQGADLISMLEEKYDMKLHLVNRLDIGTSGIVVVAKASKQLLNTKSCWRAQIKTTRP